MDKTQQVCIVIPIYKTNQDSYEQIAIKQCFKILGHYQIYFAVPERMEEFIQSSPYVVSGQAAYKTFKDAFFVDIPGYNRLLKSTVFYKQFLDFEYLLIYQPDAFVFKDELLDWCNRGYDYIGAPLFEGHEFALAESPIVGQGNGGFSLRNVKTCYRVITNFRKVNYHKEYTDRNRSFFRNFYRYIKHHLVYNYSLYPLQPIINEDLFWSEVIPAVFPEFKVPEPVQSVGFSFEVNPEVLFELNNQQLPFGCHAWWRYNLDFWRKYIKEQGYEL